MKQRKSIKWGPTILGPRDPGPRMWNPTPETQDVGRGGSTWDPKSEVCEVKEAELVY